MPVVRLRPLVSADLARVAEIERQTFGDPWSRRAFSELLGQPHIRSLAADDERGELVGYGIASLVVDEGEILNIAVEQASRGRGLGRRLLAALLERLRDEGAARIHLEVGGGIPAPGGPPGVLLPTPGGRPDDGAGTWVTERKERMRKCMKLVDKTRCHFLGWGLSEVAWLIARSSV
jgi:ribosomal-protein-alanine N-acetyltransferase